MVNALKRFPKRAVAVAAAAALCSLMASPGLAAAADAAQPAQKDETVHVYTDADGSVERTEVEVLLKNPDGAAQLADATALTALEADDEDQSFTGSGASIVWQTDGEDVSYTGATSAVAPVTVKVTYTLDGVQVSPGELAGKSGKVAIRYDYENRSARAATVNGGSATVYTPFTCITALMLDGKSFKDIHVENAKVIEDGSDVIVTGYAMPGLKESLGSLADDASIPDYFQVTADVTDFELNSALTIVTAGLLSDFDADELGIGDVDGAGALTDAMGQLIEGSDTLTQGLGTLADSIGQLGAGTDELAAGATSLAGGLYALTYGSGGNPGLKDAASGATDIVEGLGQLDSALQGAASETEGLPAAASALAGLAERYAGEADVVAAAQEELAAVLAANPDADVDSLKQVLDDAATMSTGLATVSPQVSAASDGVKDIAASLAALVANAKSLPAGLSSALDVAKQLTEGAYGLEAGAEQLGEATSKLQEGAQSAAEGSQALTDGMRTFNDEGVAKLVDTLESDYGGLLDRMNALSDAAKSYDNFSGKPDGVPSSVKFVFETAAIGK